MPVVHELKSRWQDLVFDVAYGSTKELLRVLIAASLTTIFLAARQPKHERAGITGWLKVVGAAAMLVLVMYVVVDRIMQHCDKAAPLCGFTGVSPPPPPHVPYVPHVGRVPHVGASIEPSAP